MYNKNDLVKVKTNSSCKIGLIILLESWSNPTLSDMSKEYKLDFWKTYYILVEDEIIIYDFNFRSEIGQELEKINM